jgi:hypothetical protein
MTGTPRNELATMGRKEPKRYLRERGAKERRRG